MFDPISAAISVGSNLLGGWMKDNSQEKIAREQMAFQREQNAQNIALQKEFAQSGIQWRADDARKAGIHPLAALGSGVTSFSNVVSSAPSRAASSMGDAIARSGQDISRAMMATANQDTRQQMMANSVQELNLENLKLRNDFIKMQIASGLARASRGGQVGPPMPSDANFTVPENAKVEERPPLMLGGSRWRTNPNTSPMKAWEDQYGDEGPVSWTMPLFIMYNDFLANYGQPATWPRQTMNWAWQNAKKEFDFGSNPRVAKPLGRR